MFKKGESRASSLFIISILIVSVFIIFGTIVTSLGSLYNKPALSEFDGYEAIKNETFSVTNEVVRGINDSGTGDLAEGQGFEDLSYLKGLKLIGKFPSMLSATNKLIYETNKQINFIPPIVFDMIIVLISITIIVLIIRAFVRSPLV